MPGLKLFNTLDGEKVSFTPADPGHVRLYACGPTVYNYAHIGNARMAVVFDLLVRVLRELYPKVTYVSNITDVDDKIMAASLETGEAIDVITRRYESIYNEDMAALGVAKPDIQPRATEHIQEMIALIGSLIQRNHAYAAEGHVLFHVPSYPAYGKLSGRNRDEQIAGARVDVAPFKRDPADFVLWKPSTQDQPGWDSPWGRGRPGWHIECSAMSEKHLGIPFDIHGGGADLKFPHHENEIAQSVCAHGHVHDLRAFARYWVHNGFVTVAGEKMSKSIGNIRLVHNLIEGYPGEVLRLALLSAHYHQPLDWSEDTIQQAKATLDRLYQSLYVLADIETASDAALPESLFDALCDDLNTPKALAVLNALAKEAAEKRTSALKGHLLAAGNLLGILQNDPAAWLGYGQVEEGIDPKQIEKLLSERTAAKAARNFTRADEIRAELSTLGIAIEDTPQGPKWKKAG
jgi:cysteinyl-tRNA synthetase